MLLRHLCQSLILIMVPRILTLCFRSSVARFKQAEIPVQPKQTSGEYSTEPVIEFVGVVSKRRHIHYKLCIVMQILTSIMVQYMFLKIPITSSKLYFILYFECLSTWTNLLIRSFSGNQIHTLFIIIIFSSFVSPAGSPFFLPRSESEGAAFACFPWITSLDFRISSIYGILNRMCADLIESQKCPRSHK